MGFDVVIVIRVSSAPFPDVSILRLFHRNAQTCGGVLASGPQRGEVTRFTMATTLGEEERSFPRRRVLVNGRRSPLRRADHREPLPLDLKALEDAASERAAAMLVGQKHCESMEGGEQNGAGI